VPSPAFVIKTGEVTPDRKGCSLIASGAGTPWLKAAMDATAAKHMAARGLNSLFIILLIVWTCGRKMCRERRPSFYH